MPRIQVTIVPKEVQDILDTVIDDILNDLTRPPINHQTKSLKQLIPHHFYPNYNVYQGQCYKQYSSNLCGYHATFNALCCLHMYLNFESEYVIDSGASFWKFKKKVEKFLLEIKKANSLEDKWPWRESDILYGDFERTYNKICKQMFDDFDIFRENHRQFTYIDFTWQFQYQNLLLSEQTKAELNKKISYFQNYKDEKPLIFGFMLGITCHWTVLMVFKRNGKSQYWYFDSHNDILLDYNDEQITKYIEDYEQERLQMKKTKLTNFEKEKFFMSVKDSQTSIKLIVDCLQGKASIDQYLYNQMFNVFAKPIEQAFKIGQQQLLAHTIKDYWYNIEGFFSRNTFFKSNQICWHLFSEDSKDRMLNFLQAAQEARKHTCQGKRLYQILQNINSHKGYF